MCSPYLNPENLRRLVETCRSQDEAKTLVLQVIQIYLKVSPQVLIDLRQAEVSKQAERMRQAAHKLKGMNLNIGAPLLAQYCRTLEDDLYKRRADRDLSEYQSQLTTLEQATSLLWKELNQIVDTGAEQLIGKAKSSDSGL